MRYGGGGCGFTSTNLVEVKFAVLGNLVGFQRNGRPSVTPNPCASKSSISKMSAGTAFKMRIQARRAPLAFGPMLGFLQRRQVGKI
jgi:hypothetical protein